MSNTNSANRSPMNCNGCGSNAGWAIIKAEHVTFREYYHNQLYAVIISFGCKHCDCGTSFQVTYCYDGREGVRVKEGYPDDYAKALTLKLPLQLPALAYSQVNAVKDGVKCELSCSAGYNTNRSEDWANRFVAELHSATAKAEKSPPCLSKTVTVDIAKEGTGRVLRRNVKMEFKVKKFFSNNVVTLAQMADEALEQSGLKAQGYQWRQVAQRKELADGSIDDVEANVNDPIKHGAVYTVVASKQE